MSIPRLSSRVTSGRAACGESGQTMAEYSVMLGVITVAVVFALVFLSGAFTGVLSSVASVI